MCRARIPLVIEVNVCKSLFTTVIIVNMNRQFIASCALAAASILSTAHSQLKLRRGTVCWPLSFSGITLGVTSTAAPRQRGFSQE